MPRRPYCRVSAEDRQRIVDSYLEGHDYVSCAERLGIRRSTAYSIVRSYQDHGDVQPRTRQGGRPPKLDAEMRDFLVMLVEDLPTVTLRELNTLLRNTWPHKPHVSESTIARALSGMLISVKLCNDVPANRNRPDIVEERKRFSEWMLRNGINTRRVYIDETGFNLYTRRAYGRAPVGQRVNRIVGSQRGRNVTFLVAITPDAGVLHFECFARGVKHDDVASFIRTLSVILDIEPATILMDNAPSHRHLQNPSNIHTLRFLPPYSPFLNPIENCFSVLKADAKQRLSHIQLLVDNPAMARENRMGLVEWRTHCLIREVSAAMAVITPETVSSTFRNADSYLIRCLNGEQILH